MIDTSLVTTTTTYGGSPSVSTLNGTISLEQAAGRLAVYDENLVARTVVDIRGLTTTDPDGTQRVRVGIASDDGRAGNWTTKPGVDLRDSGI